MKRLQQVSSKSFALLLRGSKLAWSFSEAAVSWGNLDARSWRSNATYIDFLGRFCLPYKL